MIAITMPAKAFSMDERVRRANGSKLYRLRHTIKIIHGTRGALYDSTQCPSCKTVCFLVSDIGDIEAISADTPMSVDMQTVDEAREYLLHLNANVSASALVQTEEDKDD